MIVFNCLTVLGFFTQNVFAKEAQTVDLTGYWESESGVKVFIPIMRDGPMPLVLMNKKPTVLMGKWDWASQTLQVNNSRFSMVENRLVMTNHKVTQTHRRLHTLTPQFNHGIWYHEGKGELLISNDGKTEWIIQIPPSQQATIHKAKWWPENEVLKVRLDGRCTLDWLYEPDDNDLMYMLCPNTEHDWLRIHKPTTFQTVDWSGTWTSKQGWTLEMDMSGQQFGKVYIESEERIIDFTASWIGRSEGHSILLERKKESNAILSIDPDLPNRATLRIDGLDIVFTR